MGLDATMAVALKPGSNIDEINKRFKETHSKDDCLFPKEENIIDGKVPSYWSEGFEYIESYRVNTNLSRFYGPGYERGPAFRIVLQLEWLRHQPEVIEVYYGSDAEDYPSVWSKEDSYKLLDHYFKQGNTPYSNRAKGTWT